MSKRKLLSTPSRLFKLLLPLKSINNAKQQNRPVEPLALLVHPRQPLSYLERLIQSELPPIRPGDGGPARPPEIAFKAVNVGDTLMSERDSEGHASKAERFLRGGEGEGGVETGGGLGKLSTEPKSGEGGLVRWSTSTELGDFVRDAARGKEFIIEVEKNESVAVGVPSFHQRTHYQRQKLMEITRKIAAEKKLKDECDKLAHRSAQRLSMGGFAVLMSWWGGVCWLTFGTHLGWDFMEPVTYLAGIFLVILGYGWFLYYRREVSYRALLHMTVNSRQMKLYTERGFDIDRWEELISDARSLRREIRNIADQYDVKWDETNDEAGGEKVLKLLKDAEKKSKKNSEVGDEEEEDVVEIGKEKKDL
ncbi:DUF607-domain-containing protein [Morchella conica CCBAS932]|uniref:Calcium uniporter protein n=1 Tax=Morchella conica CCBAS932 TaxID=1392247 RepID=A0A3N4KWE3_9PEZI|nr:DUF607-domain-containing protein [Morchella conica CCBAS932]